MIEEGETLQFAIEPYRYAIRRLEQDWYEVTTQPIEGGPTHSYEADEVHTQKLIKKLANNESPYYT